MDAHHKNFLCLNSIPFPFNYPFHSKIESLGTISIYLRLIRGSLLSYQPSTTASALPTLYRIYYSLLNF